MNSLSLEQKQAQFHEFFTIKHRLHVNMTCLGEQFSLPELDALDEHMPYAFRIATQMSSLDPQALRNLRNLGEQAKELSEFLNHQARKIDLMMSYILQQQDDPDARYFTTEFGGGGLTLQTESQIAIGEHAQLKIFLSDEAAAVFCFAEVIRCEPIDERFHTSLIYTRIREQDQELLVRASLHQQTQQLRARAQQQGKSTAP